MGLLSKMSELAEGLSTKWSKTSQVLVSGGDGAIWKGKRYDTFAKEAFLTNVISYRCIDEIARSVESIEWKLQNFKKRSEPKDVDDHWLYDLMFRPNPEQSWGELVYRHEAFGIISGNSYMERIALSTGKNRGVPKELWSHRPDRMTVEANPNTGLRRNYKYVGPSGRIVDWPVDPLTGASDIWHQRGFNPLNDWYGAGPVEPTSREIDTSNEAMEWNKQLLQNSGRPGMLFIFDGAIGETEYNRLEKKLRDKYGGPKNAGKHLIIEGKNAKVEPYGWSPTEMDYIEGNRELARRIALGFGVPPQLLGIPGDNTYCLPAHSRVSTPFGGIPISDIREGDVVYSFVSGELKLNRVEKAGRTGNKLVYEIKTKNRTLQATGNHPILVRKEKKNAAPLNNYRNSPELGYTLEYVNVSDLRIGDVLIQVSEIPDRYIMNNNGVSIEEMELFGFYLGDGYSVAPVTLSDGRGYKRGGGLRFAIPRGAEYGDYYIKLAKEFTKNNPYVQDHCVSFSGNAAVKRIQELGFAGNAHTKRIPEWVYQTSKDYRFALLRGIVDSDGSVDNNGRMQLVLCNEDLVRDVWHLCLSCGLQVGRITRRNYIATLPGGRKFEATAFNFMVSNADDVLKIGTHTASYMKKILANVNKPRKKGVISTGGANNKQKLNALINSEQLHFSTIKSIEALTKTDVYDLSVEGGHNFIADGVVVHNSNYAEAKLAFWENTVFWYAKRFGRGLSAWLFDPSERLMMVPDYDSIPALEPRRKEQFEKAERADFLRINEKRGMCGYEPYGENIPDQDDENADPADKIYQQSSMMALGEEPAATEGGGFGPDGSLDNLPPDKGPNPATGDGEKKPKKPAIEEKPPKKEAKAKSWPWR